MTLCVWACACLGEGRNTIAASRCCLASDRVIHYCCFGTRRTGGRLRPLLDLIVCKQVVAHDGGGGFDVWQW